MTEVISLSEKAYGTLKKLKRCLLEFAGRWKGVDLDRVFSIVLADRERAVSRDYDLMSTSLLKIVSSNLLK